MMGTNFINSQLIYVYTLNVIILYFCSNFKLTMKRLNYLVLAAAAMFVFASCGGGSSSQDSSSSEASSEPSSAAVEGTFAVNTTESVVAWKGEVAGVYGHNGVINVQEGSLSAADGRITGGEIVIDMTSIQPLDTASYTASGKTPMDLVNHLSTGDFFLVEEFPTSSFVIKAHNGNQLVGDLTIRGNTSEETVDLTSLEISENGVVGEGTLVFDRQKYEVSWEHYIQDYILSDDISLTLNIVAAK